jgi:alpha-galactosidase/6-phospho-beta-glucosidase family protein
VLKYEKGVSGRKKGYKVVPNANDYKKSIYKVTPDAWQRLRG